MSTLTERDTSTLLAGLPRVNLLPPEIEEQRRFKRRAARPRRRRPRRGRCRRRARRSLPRTGEQRAGRPRRRSRPPDAQLQARDGASTPTCRVVYAQVEAAEAQLAQAMGQEVRWSYFLNDLSLGMPGKVWLTSMTVTQNVDSRGCGCGPGATRRHSSTPGIGTVTFEGKGYKHNDVAAWLDALAKQKGLTQPVLHQLDQAADRRPRTRSPFTSQATSHRGRPLRALHREGGQLT